MRKGTWTRTGRFHRSSSNTRKHHHRYYEQCSTSCHWLEKPHRNYYQCLLLQKKRGRHCRKQLKSKCVGDWVQWRQPEQNSIVFCGKPKLDTCKDISQRRNLWHPIRPNSSLWWAPKIPDEDMPTERCDRFCVQLSHAWRPSPVRSFSSSTARQPRSRNKFLRFKSFSCSLSRLKETQILVEFGTRLATPLFLSTAPVRRIIYIIGSQPKITSTHNTPSSHAGSLKKYTAHPTSESLHEEKDLEDWQDYRASHFPQLIIMKQRWRAASMDADGNSYTCQVFTIQATAECGRRWGVRKEG